MNKRNFIFAFLILASSFVIYYYFIDSHKISRVEGVDKNSNGVWDEYEPLVVKFASTENETKALTGFIKHFQEILVKPEYGIDFNKNSDDITKDFFSKSLSCLFFVYKKSRNDMFELSDLEDELLSTSSRLKSDSKFNGFLSGGVYPPWTIEKNGNPCPFEF